MFKNLLDKAKNAIEDIDITLKNGNNTKAKKLMEYDANFFTFALEGGPLHTTTVKAVAKIKTGSYWVSLSDNFHRGESWRACSIELQMVYFNS